MNPRASDLEELSRGAGRILHAGLEHPIHVEHKGEIDLVTEIDRRSEAYLVDAIRSRFPNDRIITEESGVLEGNAGQVWYLDPLDGTVNYAHRVPIFAVSIAYAENGKVVLAGVYDPMQDEYFCAERGGGARLNGKPIQVSDTPTLNGSLLATGFAYDIRTRSDNNLNHFANLALRAQGVRRLGSAALDLGYVAAGRLDGYWEVSIQSWDIAAGALIVQEAGGIATSVHGAEDYFSPSPSILATNSRIHTELLAALHP